MKRSGRVLLVAHCVLNQNAVVCPLARASGAFPEILMLLAGSGLGLVQLPCPETLWLGGARSPMSYEEYNCTEYVQLNRQLARDVNGFLEKMAASGTVPVGIVGVGSSPTCSMGGKRGHLMEAIAETVLPPGVPWLDIPENYGDPAVNGRFAERFKGWIASLSEGEARSQSDICCPGDGDER